MFHCVPVQLMKDITFKCKHTQGKHLKINNSVTFKKHSNLIVQVLGYKSKSVIVCRMEIIKLNN